MTPVVVQSVTPTKGMKACACCNTSTGCVAAAANIMGLQHSTLCPCDPPQLLNCYAVSSQAREELLLALWVGLAR